MTNSERCKDCRLNPKRQSDWFYCNNPENFRDFTIIRISKGYTTKKPTWCLKKELLV